jgi:hypothetical protein
MNTHQGAVPRLMPGAMLNLGHWRPMRLTSALERLIQWCVTGEQGQVLGGQMRHSSITLILAILLLMGASPETRAQPVNGFYVAGGAGSDLSQSQTIKSGPVAGGDPGSAAERAAAAINRPGLTESGSAGWGFGNGLRMEMQGVHSENSTGGVAP